MTDTNRTFSVTQLPRIEFDAGAFSSMPGCLRQFGSNVLLADWTAQLELPALQTDLADIVKNARGSSMQTNPIILSDAELIRILQKRL